MIGIRGRLPGVKSSPYGETGALHQSYKLVSGKSTSWMSLFCDFSDILAGTWLLLRHSKGNTFVLTEITPDLN